MNTWFKENAPAWSRPQFIPKRHSILQHTWNPYEQFKESSVSLQLEALLVLLYTSCIHPVMSNYWYKSPKSTNQTAACFPLYKQKTQQQGFSYKIYHWRNNSKIYCDNINFLISIKCTSPHPFKMFCAFILPYKFFNPCSICTFHTNSICSMFLSFLHPSNSWHTETNLKPSLLCYVSVCTQFTQHFHFQNSTSNKMHLSIPTPR